MIGTVMVLPAIRLRSLSVTCVFLKSLVMTFLMDGWISWAKLNLQVLWETLCHHQLQPEQGPHIQQVPHGMTSGDAWDQLLVRSVARHPNTIAKVQKEWWRWT